MFTSANIATLLPSLSISFYLLVSLSIYLKMLFLTTELLKHIRISHLLSIFLFVTFCIITIYIVCLSYSCLPRK